MHKSKSADKTSDIAISQEDEDGLDRDVAKETWTHKLKQDMKTAR